MTYGHLVLLYGFCSKKFTTLLRYPVNFLGTVVSTFILFLLLFEGGRAIAPVRIGRSIDAIIVGFFLFVTVNNSFTFLEGMINNEAKYGTLEQLYASRFDFTTVMFGAAVADTLVSVGMAAITLAFTLLVTGETLTLDMLTVVPILSLTILHTIGLGFLFGGVALLYKRIRGWFNMAQYVFVAVISFAMTDRLWPRLFPTGQGASMLHRAMSDGTALVGFPVIDHVVLLGTAVTYLAVGFSVFYVAQHRARQRGLLDDY